MTGARTPRVEREERKAETSLALARSLSVHGISQSRVAADGGVSGTMVAEWCDPERERSLPVADLAGMPLEVRLDMVRHLLGEGFAVVELPAASSEACDFRAIANAQKETSEAVTAAFEAFSKGHITGAAGEVLVRECNEGIGSLLTIREVAKQAVKSRVRPLRQVGGAA